MSKLKVLDCFSGIGGFSLGLERTGGFETVAFCEIEPFCQKVLKKHWPDVPIYEDVRTLNYDGPVDLICGGYPCQPFSVAGKREGERDDRHLWPAMFSLIKKHRPTWVIGENVAGHISMGLDEVLTDLESEAYSARTFVIPACAVDAPHRRDRVWIVGNARRISDEPERTSELRHGTAGTVQGETREQRVWAEIADTSKDVADSQITGLEGQPRHGENGSEPGRIAAQKRGSACEGGLSSGGSLWLPEPNVGRVVARVSSWMDGDRLDGNASNSGTAEILQRLRDRSAAQAVQWPIRGHGGIQEAEILLSQVCQYEGPPKPLGNISLARPEAPQKPVRGVWFDGQATCASCRRQAREQRRKQHPDTLRVLSQLLTCDCKAAWIDRTGTPSETSRIDRLKSLGNAVVPQVVQRIGEAILHAEQV